VSTRTVSAALLAIALAAGCGGDATGPADGGPMSAIIDGARWSASSSAGAIQVVRTDQFIVVAGSSIDLVAISFSIPNVTGPGTHPVVPPSPYSAFVNEQFGERSWISSLPGGTGSVTVTSVSATRIAGTFQFEAVPVPNTAATGKRVVTDGRFDVEF
jgi:hypothetical protein